MPNNIEADYSGSSPKFTWRETGVRGYAPHIEKFEFRIQALWQEAGDTLETNKGRITRMLEILPESLRIKQTIVPIHKKNALRHEIERGLFKNKEVGLRTCYREGQIPPAGTGPWIMGLRNLEMVSAFFGETPIPEPPVWTGFQENYQKWLNRGGLTEVIVMGNPPGLGTKDLKKEHFVFRVETYGISQLRIELRLGTDQLRDIEAKTDTRDLIEISMTVPESEYGIYSPGKITISPGKNYLNDPISSKVIQQVNETVFGKWCQDPQNHLYYILLALDTFGLGAIEFQGRYDNNGNVNWILAHGFRGVREEKFPIFPPERMGGD